MEFVKTGVTRLGIAGAVLAGTYYGATYILGHPEQTMVQCNSNLQAFDLDGVPIYWRVYEAPCFGSDVNYEAVRLQVEKALLQPGDEDEGWPTSTCSYAQVGQNGYVWGFGTDLDEVDGLDCLQPLRDLQTEKEDNIDYGEYFKELLKGQTNVDGLLTNLF